MGWVLKIGQTIYPIGGEVRPVQCPVLPNVLPVPVCRLIERNDTVVSKCLGRCQNVVNMVLQSSQQSCVGCWDEGEVYFG